jgi:hypothetical protein
MISSLHVSTFDTANARQDEIVGKNTTINGRLVSAASPQRARNISVVTKAREEMKTIESNSRLSELGVSGQNSSRQSDHDVECSTPSSSKYSALQTALAKKQIESMSDLASRNNATVIK